MASSSSVLSKKNEKTSGESCDGVKRATKKHSNNGGKNAALLAQLKEHKRLAEQAKVNLEKAKEFAKNMKEKLAKNNSSKSVN